MAENDEVTLNFYAELFSVGFRVFIIKKTDDTTSKKIRYRSRILFL
jgi:hypothetical protein